MAVVLSWCMLKRLPGGVCMHCMTELNSYRHDDEHWFGFWQETI